MICVVVQTVIFGFGNVITKFAYESVTPLWCMVLRFGLALAVFALVFGPRMVRELRGAKLADWVPAAACLAVGYIACNLAIDVTTATNVGFLVALPVVFAPFIAQVVRRVRYPRAMIPFQVAVVGGLYLLCCNGGALSFGMGEFVGLGSSALFALGIVLSERGLSEIGPAAMSAVQTGGAFLFSLGGAVATEPAPAFGTVSVGTWAAVAFLAIAGTCLAFWLQNKALAHIPAATVSVILCSEPVVTAIISFFVLGEVLSMMGVLGAAIIVGCTVAATLLDSRAEKDQVEELPAFDPAFEVAQTRTSMNHSL